MSDWSKSLLSLENLDRTSPELWPEPVPGFTEFAARNSLSKHISVSPLGELDPEDYSLLNYYRGLSTEALLVEVKKLHDIAYRLGQEEAKEMTRGRLLNILNAKKRHP